MHDPATTPSRISQLLAAVDRPGDFFATGTATPAITVDRLCLPFPVPDAQARGLIELAGLAPYGRGGETLVDPYPVTGVRFAQGARPGDLGTMSPFSTASLQLSGVSS